MLKYEAIVVFKLQFPCVNLVPTLPYDKTCFCYKKTDRDLEGCTILSYDTEREMLEAFSEYLVENGYRYNNWMEHIWF